MVEVSEELAVARSSDEVWAVLADFGGIARWAPNVHHSCLTTTQTEGAGTVRRIQAGRNTLLEQILQWEPGRHLGYSIEGLPSVIGSVTNTWHLHPAGPSTTITLTTRIDAGSRPLKKLVVRPVGGVLAKASRQMLRGLDDHLREIDRVNQEDRW